MAKHPDENTLPSSKGRVLDRAGIWDKGYLDKKGTPSGEGAQFNRLPPGSDISNQQVSDVKRTTRMRIKEVVDMDYPGDGRYGSDA